jgi:hypothetical protein
MADTESNRNSATTEMKSAEMHQGPVKDSDSTDVESTLGEFKNTMDDVQQMKRMGKKQVISLPSAS